MTDTNNDFLATDYKVPQQSNYLRLTEGDHTFRVMSSAIVGYQYFNQDNKPVRSREPFDETPVDIKKDGRVNHFWAFVVYNVDDEKLQIFEITQKTIMAQIKALIDNKKWGNPKNYDVTITRTGAGMQDTKYTVMPNPQTPVLEVAKKQFENTTIDLEALFTGDNPFGSNEK
jgi:hypothetical protein